MLLVSYVLKDGLNKTNDKKEVDLVLESLSENFALNKKDVLYPISFKTMIIFQQKDKSLIQITKEKPNHCSI